MAGGTLLLAAVAGVLIWVFWDNSGPANNNSVTDGSTSGPKQKDAEFNPIIDVPKVTEPKPDPRIAKVRPAVENGAKFLRDRIMAPDGDFPLEIMKQERMGDQLFPGAVALVGLTLLETGTPVEDPAIARVTYIIEQNAKTMDKIYVLSTSLFFLNRRHELKPLEPKLQKLARSLACHHCRTMVDGGVVVFWQCADAQKRKTPCCRISNSANTNRRPTAPPMPSWTRKPGPR